MKNKLLILVLSLTFSTAIAQERISWVDLADVTFEKKYFPEYDNYFLYPSFGPSIKALEGQKVTITGYFLDMYPQGDVFVLSKGPFASCFFCGVGGPETAVELHFITKPGFKMDDIVTITGTLELNSDNVAQFNYILNDCIGELMN